MIVIKCTGSGTAKLTELKRYQGDLKRRLPADIKALQETLKEDGLLAPFVIWNDNGVNKLLDGHGRFEALVSMGLDDPEVLAQDYPVITVSAENDIEARKALLQITSRYGFINQRNMSLFTEGIENYRAPVIKRKTRKPYVKETSNEQFVIIRLKVPRDNAPSLIQTLRKVDNVEVL